MNVSVRRVPRGDGARGDSRTASSPAGLQAALEGLAHRTASDSAGGRQAQQSDRRGLRQVPSVLFLLILVQSELYMFYIDNID